MIACKKSRRSKSRDNEDISLFRKSCIIFKLFKALFSKCRYLIVSYVIPIDIVKDSVQQHRINCVKVPLIDNFLQLVLSLVGCNFGQNFFVEILLQEIFVEFRHFLILITSITMFGNPQHHFLVGACCGDLALGILQEVY